MNQNQIANLRSEFTVFVLGTDNPLTERLSDKVSDAGFETQVFHRADDFLIRTREYPPHIVAVELSDVTGLSLIHTLQVLSTEIKILLFSEGPVLQGVAELIRAGASDLIDNIHERMAELVPRLDLIIGHMITEFRLEQTQSLVAQRGYEEQHFQDARAALGEIDLTSQIQTFVDGLETTNDEDGLNRYLVEQVSSTFDGSPTLLLKYVPAFSTLVLGPTSKIRFESQNAVGLKVNGTFEEVQERLLSPHKISGLQKFMSQIFEIEPFYAEPVCSSDGVYGILVIGVERPSATQAQALRIFLKLHRESQRVFVLKRELHEVGEKDNLTGFYLKSLLRDKIDDEVSRARRTHLPVSLVAACVDNFRNLVTKHGAAFGDQIIRSVSQIIKKTSRRSDVLIYLGAGEFVFLLPHTAGEGATIKAEKLRRGIERVAIPSPDLASSLQLTMSFGVSDFPVLSSDSESLLQSADEALFQVITSTRNKVCLAQPENTEGEKQNPSIEIESFDLSSGLLGGSPMVDEWT